MNIIENENDEKETDANMRDQVISFVQNSNMKNKSEVNPSFCRGISGSQVTFNISSAGHIISLDVVEEDDDNQF